MYAYTGISVYTYMILHVLHITCHISCITYITHLPTKNAFYLHIYPKNVYDSKIRHGVLFTVLSFKTNPNIRTRKKQTVQGKGVVRYFWCVMPASAQVEQLYSVSQTTWFFVTIARECYRF